MAVNDVHRRLEASLPPSQRVSLVHNDLKLDNAAIYTAGHRDLSVLSDFTAQAGAANSYVAANFNAGTPFGGAIDNWLISPELTLAGTTRVTFYTRNSAEEGFDNDTLGLLFSAGAGSANSALDLEQGVRSVELRLHHELRAIVDRDAGAGAAFVGAVVGVANRFVAWLRNAMNRPSSLIASTAIRTSSNPPSNCRDVPRDQSRR